MLEIVSQANPKFKAALKLLERRGRQQQSRFLIDGLRETQYALRAGIELETLFISSQSLQQLDPIGRSWIKQLVVGNG